MGGWGRQGRHLDPDGQAQGPLTLISPSGVSVQGLAEMERGTRALAEGT